MCNPAISIAEALIKQLEQPRTEYPTPPDCDTRYLIWMCQKIIENADDWEEDKTHLWIGYVQGVMVCRQLTTVENQRNLVRELKTAQAPQTFNRFVRLYEERIGGDVVASWSVVYGYLLQSPTWWDRICYHLPHKTLQVDDRTWHQLPSGWISSDYFWTPK